MLTSLLIRSGANIVGHWPTAGYHYEASKGMASDDNDDFFIGLTIDEDRQPELTEERVTAWVAQINQELDLATVLA